VEPKNHRLQGRLSGPIRPTNRIEAAFNGLQDAGLDAEAAAALIIDVAEREPAPIRAPIGDEAAHILQLARVKSDSALDELRCELLGLNKLEDYTQTTKHSGRL
jgi:hypothetical protein